MAVLSVIRFMANTLYHAQEDYMLGDLLAGNAIANALGLSAGALMVLTVGWAGVKWAANKFKLFETSTDGQVSVHAYYKDLIEELKGVNTALNNTNTVLFSKLELALNERNIAVSNDGQKSEQIANLTREVGELKEQLAQCKKLLEELTGKGRNNV